MSGRDELRSLIRRGGVRLRWMRGLDALTLFGAGGLTILASSFALDHLGWMRQGGERWLHAISLALPLAGWLAALMRPLTARKIVHDIDAALATEDRFLTAWSFSRRGGPYSTFEEAAIGDAHGRIAGVRLDGVYPLQRPPATRALVLAGVAVITAMGITLPESVQQERRRSERIAPINKDRWAAEERAWEGLAAEAKRLGDKRLERLAAEAKETLKALEKRGPEDLKAFAAMGQWERRLEDELILHQASKEILRDVATKAEATAPTAAKPLAKALAKGDTKAAAEALEKLAQWAEHAPTPLLEKMADWFSKTAEELARAMPETAKELAKKLSPEARARLQRLLKREGSRERELPLEAPKPSTRGETEKNDSAENGKKADPLRSVNRLKRRLEDAAKKMKDENKGRAKGEKQKQGAQQPMRRGAEEIRRLHRAGQRQRLKQEAVKHLQRLRNRMRSGTPRTRKVQRRLKARHGQPPAGRQAQRLRREGGGGKKPGAEPGTQREGRRALQRTHNTERFVAGQEGTGPVLEAWSSGRPDAERAQSAQTDVAHEVRDVAEARLERDRVPAGYRRVIRQYFDVIAPKENP